MSSTRPPTNAAALSTGTRDTPRTPVGFSISIDTEEDNWIAAREGISTRNVDEIGRYNGMLTRLGLRPTYFVTYQVATSPRAAEELGAAVADGRGEIAIHVHPWNTPPFCGIEDRVTMLKNYPEDIQEQKIRATMEAIEERLGVRATSFRAGRFGAGPATISALQRCGVFVDSSVTPLLSWASYDGGPSYITAPSDVYRLNGGDDLCVPRSDGAIVEVPVSVGYTRLQAEHWRRVARVMETPLVKGLRLTGLASRAVGVRRVILSPEVSSTSDMVHVSRRMIEGGAAHLQMFLHSGSLVPGLSPFVKTAADVRRMYDSVESYVQQLSRRFNLVPCTVTEAAKRYGSPGGSVRAAAAEAHQRG